MDLIGLISYTFMDVKIEIKHSEHLHRNIVLKIELSWRTQCKTVHVFRTAIHLQLKMC